MASGAAIKSRAGSGGGSAAVKGKAAIVVKKEESSGSRLAREPKQKTVAVVTKAEVKAKPGSSTSQTVTKTTVRKRTEKKVYSLPGQKYDPPEEREPLRIFYESLSKQIPTSEMAEFWLMEHGLLSPERAKKAYEKKQRRQHQVRTGTPIKSMKQEKPESSKKPLPSTNGEVNAKKRVAYSYDDDDFIVKSNKSRR